VEPLPWSFEAFRRRALGRRPAGFALARRVGLGVAREDLTATEAPALWARHADAMARWRAFAAGAGRADVQPTAGEATLLDLKLELATRLLGPCRLCWLRCPVDRRRGELGRCGLGPGLRVYRDVVHLGEELELIPTHAVYLAGCNYRCPFCSEEGHVTRPAADPETAPAALGRSIAARRAEGAASVSFVGGVPDVSLPGILAALAATTADVPVAWNSNMSATPAAQDLLEGVVDAYVADLKHGAEACSRQGTGSRGALAVARANLRRARREAYLIVRHLVLPGHVDCCALPALDWLAAAAPGCRVNVMGQYQPTAAVRGTAWDRRPAPADLERARAHAAALGLDLEGPGGVGGTGVRAPGAAPAGDGAGFESRIRIDDAGRVVIEDLTPELAELARALAGADPDLEVRLEAGAPWGSAPPAAGARPDQDSPEGC